MEIITRDNISSKIFEDQDYYSFRVNNLLEMGNYITETFPETKYLLTLNNPTNKMVEILIKSEDSIKWLEFVMDGIRDSIDSHGIGVGQKGIWITLNYIGNDKNIGPDLEDKVLMLSRAYLVKNKHIIEDEEDLPPDPSDYGLGSW